MKKISNYVVSALCILAVAFSAGAFIKANAVQPSAALSAPAGQPVDLTYAAEKALPSVVHILSTQNSKTQTIDVQTRDPFEDFFSDPFGWFGNPNRGQGGTQKRQVQTPKRQGSGSGVIISSDGYIVTNNHVVEGADEITVTLNDNKEFSARVIGTDKTSDLALIKIDVNGLTPIAIANSDDIKVGEWVLAVGNPFNLTNTVTAGIVSAKARTMGQNGVESFIQTDAAINRGNSGGALVNVRGELIGINDMLYSETGSYVGYGFAIPTSIMNKVVADLKQYGTVQRAYIGIKGGDVKNQVDVEKEKGNDVDYGTMEGVYVSEVVEGGAAEAAGIKSGDVIVNVDGKKITKFGELTAIMANKKLKQEDLDVLGANFREITDAQKKQLNISYGLEVIKVNSGKINKAGITKGFIIQNVNNTPVKTIDQLQEVVKNASTSREPVLYIQGIYPTGKKAYFAIGLQD